MSIHSIDTLDGYLRQYGPVLARRAITSLDPLHVPDRDELPEFDGYRRALFEPQKHVVQAASRMMDNAGSGFIVGEMGTGKAQPLDCKVLTKVGWAEMGDLLVGDELIDPFGGTSQVTGVFPQGVKPVFRVNFSDGTSTRCCDDHLWLLSNPNLRFRGQPSVVLPLKDFREHVGDGASNSRRYSVPLVSPVEFDDPELHRPIDPYLLGLLIGDGCFRGGTPAISSVDEEIIRSVSLLMPDGLMLAQKNSCDWYITTGIRGGNKVNPLTEALEMIGLQGHGSDTKFVPDEYLYAPVADRIAMLQGLMDSDGYLGNATGTCIGFTTVSERLSRDVVELCRSLGGVVKVSTKLTTYVYKGEQLDGLLAYRLSMRMPPEIEPFRLFRKATRYKGTDRTARRRIVSVTPEGEAACQCISVSAPSHCYVTDDYIVTHNTIIGMSAVHTHARGRPYRALVLCPDHLIGKWVREIEETLPGVTVKKFENWKGIVPLLGRGGTVVKTTDGDPPSGAAVEADVDTEAGAESRPLVNPNSGKVTRRVARWSKPLGAEWYVLGRNQAKWLPDWVGVGEAQKGYDGRTHENGSSKIVMLGRSPKKDKLGQPVVDPKTGTYVMQTDTARYFLCPKCGFVPKGRGGVALGQDELAKSQRTCEGTYLQEIENRDPSAQGNPAAFERIFPCYAPRGPGYRNLANQHLDKKVGAEVVEKKRKYVVRKCGTPLWNFVAKPYRWPPARIIQKKMRGFFKYLVIDEVHEHKSDESAQSMACGKLMASTRHSIALTGTLIGGYANHLFPLMIRMNPETLREEGFKWGSDLPFSQAYGRVDRIITTRYDDDGGGGRSFRRGGTSMRRARNSGTSAKESNSVKPGIMPTLYGRHMLGSSLFITLEEMAEELPPLYEYVGGDPESRRPRLEQFTDDDPAKEGAQTAEEKFGAAMDWYNGWRFMHFDCAVDMDDEQKEAYAETEGALVAACNDLLKKGSMKLLGAMLHTLLGYPDRPYGWEPDFPGELAVGYFLLPKNHEQTNWVGVVTPRELSQDVIRPKEQALIDICKANVAAKHQVWVYVQMTQKRDVMPRLKKLLEAEGLRVGVLRADTVETKEREAWIAKHGRDYDVVVSHPKLVSTGLDLFIKDEKGHNFSTIVFYETGYNLFDMRQAARRSWRIGQPKDCRVYYLHYRETMQHRAMMLMSRKMAAATALEGEFSAEGLAALAGDDNAQMAMAKALKDRIDDTDIQRNWGKVGGSKAKARKKAEVVIDVEFDAFVPPPGTPSAFDGLSIEAQMIAETVVAVAARSPDLRLVDDDEAVETEKSPEVRDAVARLLALCDELGMDADLFL